MTATRRQYIPAATIDDLVVGTLQLTGSTTGWIKDQLDAIGVTLADLTTFQGVTLGEIEDLWAEKLDAILNGETIIIGGYINTVFIEAHSIVAQKLLLTDINALNLLNGPAEAHADVTAYNAALEILNLPATPQGAGLFCTTQYLGYYDNGTWRAYIAADGDAFFGNLAADNFFLWDGSSVRISTTHADGLVIESGGGLTIKSGGGVSLEGGGNMTLDGGQVKSNSDPAVNGGVIIDPHYIKGYTPAGLRVFEANFYSLTAGDFYAGDYDNGNDGIKYDHGTGTLLIRGGIQVSGPQTEPENTVSHEELVAAIAALGDLASADAVELAMLGTTIIQGGYLQTILINADFITAGELDASVVDVTNLNASNIVTGTLDASLITVINLSADAITAGKITVDQLDVIGTANIEAGAISSCVVFNKTPNSVMAASYTTLHTESITLGYDGQIFCVAVFNFLLHRLITFGETAYARITVGGTVVAEGNVKHPANVDDTSELSFPLTLCGGIAKAAGTYTINFQVHSSDTVITSYTGKLYNISGFAQGIMR